MRPRNYELEDIVVVIITRGDAEDMVDSGELPIISRGFTSQ